MESREKKKRCVSLYSLVQFGNKYYIAMSVAGQQTIRSLVVNSSKMVYNIYRQPFPRDGEVSEG
jgi:hypothetical protein